jgi:hypothetical protein
MLQQFKLIYHENVVVRKWCKILTVKLGRPLVSQVGPYQHPKLVDLCEEIFWNRNDCKFYRYTYL